VPVPRLPAKASELQHDPDPFLIFFLEIPDHSRIYIYAFISPTFFYFFIILDEFWLSILDDKKKFASFGHRNHA
jgi:hypothetical protein